MTESSQICELVVRSRELKKVVNKVSARRGKIERDLRALEDKGMIDASPHWRDGRYLYLLYPSKAGSPRRRQYVGADPQRIAEAVAAIERGRAYQSLTLKGRQLDGAIADAARAVGCALAALQGQGW